MSVDPWACDDGDWNFVVLASSPNAADCFMELSVRDSFVFWMPVRERSDRKRLICATFSSGRSHITDGMVGFG